METINENKTSLKDTVLHKIASQEVSMRSKKYFTLKIIGLIALSILVLVISAFIFNFIFFNIRINAQGYLLLFGSQGFWLFIKIFPWLWLVLDIIFIILLERLLREFRLAYRVPTLYLLVGLFLLAAVIGFALDQGTPLNDHLFQAADMQQLPQPLNNFYNNFGRPPIPNQAVCNCVLTSINGTTLVGYDVHNPSRIVTIVVPPNDPALGTLKIGQRFFAAGKFQNGILYSFGVRENNRPRQP